MDPIALIITALTSGAVLIARETAGEAIKDVYHSLKRAIQRRASGKQDFEQMLTKYEQEPEKWRAQLEEALTEVSANKDEEVITTAQKLMVLIDPEEAAKGTYDVQITGVQEVIAFVIRKREQHKVPFLVPPQPSHELIGREKLLRNLKQHLLSGESLALYGLPGVGKTSLLVELAHDSDVREHFQDGVLWAGLGQNADILSLLGTWGVLLGIPPSEMAKLTTVESRAKVIRVAIGMRRILLIIDDVWEIKAALDLKLGGPNCASLLTTRKPEIALEFNGKGAVRIRELNETEGVKLLIHLASEAVKAEPDEARSLVNAVGGLPLALVLMGKYLRKETHSGLPRRLHKALEELKKAEKRLQLEEYRGPLGIHPSLSPDVPLSLKAVIGISDEALDGASSRTLRALSVFPPKPNTFSEEAALAISCEPVEALDMLIDYGLLESSGDGRYMLHQTISDYARVNLTDETVFERMAEFFVAFVKHHEIDYSLLALEMTNILAAFQLASSRGMKEVFVKGVNAFFHFLDTRGLYETARFLLEEAQRDARSLNDGTGQAATLLNLGTVAKRCGDWTKAEKYFQEGLAIAREIGHREKTSILLMRLGGLAQLHGDYEQAEKYYQEGLAIAREIGHRVRISILLAFLGSLAYYRGDYNLAEEYSKEGLVIAREIGHRERISGLLSVLGWAKCAQSNYEQAKECFQEGLVIAREIGHQERISTMLMGLGSVSASRGDYNLAEEYSKEGLVIARKIGHRERISGLLGTLGYAKNMQGDYERAKECFQEGLVIARENGDPDGISTMLMGLSSVSRKQGNYEKAEKYSKEGLVIVREVGMRGKISISLGTLGRAKRQQGDYEKAEKYFQEGLAIAHEIGHRESICDLLLEMGELSLVRGDYGHAKESLQESLALAQEIGYLSLSSDILVIWGELHLKQQELELASKAFLDALEKAQDSGSKSLTAIAQFGLARVAAARGNNTEACHLGQKSLKTLEAIGHKKAAKVKQWLTKLPPKKSS